MSRARQDSYLAKCHACQARPVLLSYEVPFRTLGACQGDMRMTWGIARRRFEETSMASLRRPTRSLYGVKAGQSYRAISPKSARVELTSFFIRCYVQKNGPSIESNITCAGLNASRLLRYFRCFVSKRDEKSPHPDGRRYRSRGPGEDKMKFMIYACTF